MRTWPAWLGVMGLAGACAFDTSGVARAVDEDGGVGPAVVDAGGEEDADRFAAPDASPDASVDAAPAAGPLVCDPIQCLAAGGTCIGETCAIICATTDSCKYGVECPAGLTCHVLCSGRKSCKEGVSCGEAASCVVDCSGEDSCREGVTCANAAPCDVNCTGEDACQD
jgi:hypothetical protein